MAGFMLGLVVGLGIGCAGAFCLLAWLIIGRR